MEKESFGKRLSNDLATIFRKIFKLYIFSINLDESSSETTGGGESPRFLLATCGGDNLVRLWDVYTASGKLFSS